MLSSFPAAVVVGTLLGLVVWLTAVLAAEPRLAQGMNLLFFLPAALCACFFHIRRKKLPWSLVLPAAGAGCLTAALGAFLAGRMDTDLLRRLFGGLLLLTGLSELFRRPKK